MFFLALSWGGNDYAWGSATIIGLFCGSFGGIVIFLLWERRIGDTAMVPFSMLRMRILWSVSSMMFFFFGVFFIANYYLPIYFQTVRNKSPISSGVYMLPIVAFQVLLAIGSGLAGVFPSPHTHTTWRHLLTSSQSKSSAISSPSS